MVTLMWSRTAIEEGAHKHRGAIGSRDSQSKL